MSSIPPDDIYPFCEAILGSCQHVILCLSDVADIEEEMAHDPILHRIVHNLVYYVEARKSETPCRVNLELDTIEF